MTHHNTTASQVQATFTVAPPQLPGTYIYKEERSAPLQNHATPSWSRPDTKQRGSEMPQRQEN